MTSTTFFIIFIPILAILLLAINLILAPHNPYQEKDSVFECGFHSFLGQNRTQFSVSFFIFGILFLLFDLEIVLIYPYSVSSYTNDIYGLVVMMVFFVLLTLGFIFELGKNALTIESRQTLYNNGDISTPHVFMSSIGSIFKYILAVLQLFSDYLRIFKDKWAPILEWKLQNAPKPHPFTSLALQSGIVEDVDYYKFEADYPPTGKEMRERAEDDPVLVKAYADDLLKTFNEDKEDLLKRIEEEKEKGNINPDEADKLADKVTKAEERAVVLVKETSNVAVEHIDDSSDTEDLLFNFLPIIFASELPFIRILSVTYTLYRLKFFSIINAFITRK